MNTKSVFKTEGGKKVVIDYAKDRKIYRSPRNPANTGTEFTRGEDLIMHIARSGKRYFLLSRWSMWQGDNPQDELISEEQAKEFLIEKAGIVGWGGIDENDMKEIEEIFPGIFEETA